MIKDLIKSWFFYNKGQITSNGYEIVRYNKSC